MPDKYSLPRELVRHASVDSFAPDELRAACRSAGEGLGREDAREVRFRTAAEMGEMWGGRTCPLGLRPTLSGTPASATWPGTERRSSSGVARGMGGRSGAGALERSLAGGARGGPREGRDRGLKPVI
jgi:hypothetical protein